MNHVQAAEVEDFVWSLDQDGAGIPFSCFAILIIACFQLKKLSQSIPWAEDLDCEAAYVSWLFLLQTFVNCQHT